MYSRSIFVWDDKNLILPQLRLLDGLFHKKMAYRNSKTMIFFVILLENKIFVKKKCQHEICSSYCFKIFYEVKITQSFRMKIKLPLTLNNVSKDVVC